MVRSSAHYCIANPVTHYPGKCGIPYSREIFAGAKFLGSTYHPSRRKFCGFNFCIFSQLIPHCPHQCSSFAVPIQAIHEKCENLHHVKISCYVATRNRKAQNTAPTATALVKSHVIDNHAILVHRSLHQSQAFLIYSPRFLLCVAL